MLGIKTIDFFYEVIIQLSLKFTAAQRTRMHCPLKHIILFLSLGCNSHMTPNLLHQSKPHHQQCDLNFTFRV